MKENSTSSDVKNTKEPNSISLSKSNIPDFNNFFDSFFSFKSSYNELKESKIIELSILNSEISTKEYPQPNKYLTPEIISLIKELKEKYKNCKLTFIENSPYILKNTQLNFPESFNTLTPDKKFLPFFPQDKVPKDFNSFDFPSKINKLPFFNNFENPIFPFMNNSSLIENNLFLNHKRKKPNNEKKKRYKTNLVFISNRKNKTKNINEKKANSHSDEEYKNKKIIFRLTKGERNKNKLRTQKEFNTNKEKKQPGRKKKNSGEVGTHNKFSKDNMMRKLKNKVMESSRKLINDMIKIEGGNELKSYKEIRKIEGVYNQELNIKFNFWFYFQQLKDIFQFNMSQKYSKGELDSNVRLIEKIYSVEKRQKFVKTRQLLDMKFHEYYHSIFLGENKNWTFIYDIKENKYQLDYFLNNSAENENDKDYFKYKETLYNLAWKYELFFLKKNPRLNINKKNEEKESHAKQIIKDMSNEEFEHYKYLFILIGSSYNHELGNMYRKYLHDNKNKFSLFKPNQLYSNFRLNNNVNSHLQNKGSIQNNSTSIENTQKNTKIINNGNKSKYNIFGVSKKLLFEITKQVEDKNKKSSFIFKNSLKKDFINNLDNTNEFETKQYVEKEIQPENQLNIEDLSQNIEILI